MQEHWKDYTGTKLVIRYCEQAPKGTEIAQKSDQLLWQPQSLRDALAHFPVGKHNGLIAKIAARRQQLANEGKLRSPDYFNTEGELPNGKHSYAIKIDRLRVYGWFSSQHKSVFLIRHFAFKKGQKLAQEDSNRVIGNWCLFEQAEK